VRKLNLNIRKILATLLWTGISVFVIFILVSAKRHQEESKCTGIEVTIHGVNNNFFIDKKDVVSFINAQNKPDAIGNPIGTFNLRRLETLLEKQVWIQSADLYFSDQNVLEVTIEEREPVARVFNNAGQSFYLDSSAKVLPLSDRLSARVPVFTGFPALAINMAKADSSLLNAIVDLGIALQADEFLQAMIEQTDITYDRKFELIPKLGKQIISFGTAADIPKKFAKLKAFSTLRLMFLMAFLSPVMM
jgi:cell division protein FtsQ